MLGVKTGKRHKWKIMVKCDKIEEIKQKKKKDIKCEEKL